MTDIPAIRRRAGTAATFAATMLGRLGQQPALDSFTERRTDDPSIALVDAWSAVLDVLTFYSERLANEGYLPTATEAASVDAMAHSVGYQPAHGRAAATWLAFTLEEAAGAPQLVPLPVGTKVGSMPGPGEVPQNYETIEPLDARPAWNAIPARTGKVQQLGPGAREAYVDGVRTDLAAGDAVLLVGSEREESTTAGEWAFRLLAGVELLPALAVTRLSWTDPLRVTPDPSDARLFVLRRHAGVFGANAPDARLIDAAVTAAASRRVIVSHPVIVDHPRPDDLPEPSETGNWAGWSVIAPGGTDNIVDLDGLYPTAVGGSWAVLSGTNATELYRVEAVREASRTDYALTARVSRLNLQGPSVDDLFGDEVRETSVWVGSEILPLSAVPKLLPVQGDRIELARSVPTIAAGRTVVVRGPRPLIRVAEGVRGLVAVREQESSEGLHAGDVLEVVGPAVRNGNGSVSWPTDRGVVAARSHEILAIRPPDDAEIYSEIAVVAGPTPETEFVDSVVFDSDLTGCYDRESVRVLANVATATHGETRTQVVGSGDASTPYQRFKLAQLPLTYVAAPSGAVVSTLEVRVDGRLWTEVPQLYRAGPEDEVYACNTDADGVTTVEFGDGLTGSRLPTGTNNVTATYRIGTGLTGRVAAGQLTLPMTRPLGLKAVTNPLPAGLAADPEPADSVRANAARAALTLDRVVSLRDLEDFARTVAGIAKARVSRLWDGHQLIVHLTVAGTAGQDVDEQALKDLEAVLRAAGDSRMPLTVQAAELVGATVSVTVFVASGYDRATVVAAVTAKIEAALASEARELAEPLTMGDILLAAHRVPGVEAVTVSEPAADVAALPARVSAGVIHPAQLVALAPHGLTVT